MQAALLRILAITAILFASLTMLSGHGALAAPAVATKMSHAVMAAEPAALAGHCADMDQRSTEQPASNIDCMIACSALPAIGNDYVFERLPISPARIGALTIGIHGVDLQADPPPPRLS